MKINICSFCLILLKNDEKIILFQKVTYKMKTIFKIWQNNQLSLSEVNSFIFFQNFCFSTNFFYMFPGLLTGHVP